jgi:hypothetical protein
VRVDGIYLRGNGIRLPATLNVQDAIDSGECEPKLVARTDVTSVAYSPDESAAEMGVKAAQQALARAGSTGEDVELILHATTYTRARTCGRSAATSSARPSATAAWRWRSGKCPTVAWPRWTSRCAT